MSFFGRVFGGGSPRASKESPTPPPPAAAPAAAPATPPAAVTLLTVGESAPAFSAKTHTGEYVNLNLAPVKSLTNNANGEYATGVLLWFYPRALTGG
jgi:hypothetical protein